MAATLLALLALLMAWTARAQTPTVGWAKALSGGYTYNYSYVVDTCSADADGNLYFVGSFSTSLFALGNPVLTNRSAAAGHVNGLNGFVAKSDALGNLLWVRQIGGTGWDVASVCATDGGGYVYVTGMFGSTICVLGTNVLTNATLDNFSTDFYLAKFDPQGNVLWARQAGGIYMEEGTSVSVDPAGNVRVVGSFNSTNITIGTNLLSNPDSTEFYPEWRTFLAAYSPNGDPLWARALRTGATGQSEPFVRLENDGSCFVFERFHQQVELGSMVLTNSGGSNSAGALFVAKYDASGDVVWANEICNAPDNLGFLIPHGFAFNASHECFVAGTFTSASGVQFPGTTLPRIGSYQSAFVAKIDSAGNFLWVKQLDGGNEAWASGVSVDPLGNCYATYGVNGGMLVRKYTGNGDLLLSKPLPGLAAGCLDRYGNVYLFGQAGGVQNFDGIVISSSGSYYYAARLDGPALKIQPQSDQVVLSWPTNAVGLKLECSTDSSGNAWSPVTNIPVAVGDQLTVTNPIAGSSRIYRLRNY